MTSLCLAWFPNCLLSWLDGLGVLDVFGRKKKKNQTKNKKSLLRLVMFERSGCVLFPLVAVRVACWCLATSLLVVGWCLIAVGSILPLTSFLSRPGVRVHTSETFINFHGHDLPVHTLDERVRD